VADFTKTITVSVNLFGVAPSNKWNAHNWNAFLWGEGTTGLEARVVKVITESVTPTLSVQKAVQRVRSLALTLSGETSSETLKDAAGYLYVFPDRTTDAEGRDIPTWTSGVAATASWATAALATVTWS